MHELRGKSNIMVDPGGSKIVHLNKCFVVSLRDKNWKDIFYMFQNLLENFDDIVITVGSGGSAAGIAIANYLTGSKLKWDFCFSL